MNYFTNHCEMTGYEPKTTFWDDFTVAESFGVKSITNTYQNTFNEWNHDVVYITELAIVMNLKLWYWYENGNDELAKVYDALWKDCDAWCCNNLRDDDLKYYLETTDWHE